MLPHCGLDRIVCNEVPPHLGGGLPLFEQRVRLVPADRGALNDARSEPDVPALVTEDQFHPPSNTRQPDGQALQYGIGVGRQGFAWKGVARVERKSEWPDWIPPSDMMKRRPDLPARMAGGIENPLGARALYLFEDHKDTLFRIHGTNEPRSIGKAVSSGCIRMLNADVIDLYGRVAKGTKVVVE